MLLFHQVMFWGISVSMESFISHIMVSRGITIHFTERRYGFWYSCGMVSVLIVSVAHQSLRTPRLRSNSCFN